MTESSPAGERIFKENDVLYKPPGEKPDLRFAAGGAGTLTIEFEPAPVKPLALIGFPADKPFALRSAPCALVARKILRELASPDALTPQALEALTLQLLVEIMRKKTGADCSAPGWLRGVRERVVSPAGEPVRVRELAKAARVHPAHLSQAFRARYGESVGQLLRRTRVERAAKFLQETSMSLVQIAIECGFSDQSHFCRVFRNVTGFAPSEFRRMFRRP
jgi:AraC family transcriptional regulator